MTADPSAATEAEPISVLVVDDHVLFTQSLVRLLSDSPDIRVVGTCVNGAEAERVVREAKPDVILMDLLLPDMTGAQVTARINESNGRARVLMLTGLADRSTLRDAIRSGCVGHLAKTESVDTVIDAIRRAAAGEVLIDPELRSELENENAPGSSLTRREREVLELLAKGMSTREVAATLHVSLNTARNHIQRLLPKLGAHSKLEAVAIATREGLVRRRPEAESDAAPAGS